MDPQAAIDTFNHPDTCKAERADIAEGLLTWANMGAFAPIGTLDPYYIAELSKSEPSAANAARIFNRVATVLGGY